MNVFHLLMVSIVNVNFLKGVHSEADLYEVLKTGIQHVILILFVCMFLLNYFSVYQLDFEAADQSGSKLYYAFLLSSG